MNSVNDGEDHNALTSTSALIFSKESRRNFTSLERSGIAITFLNACRNTYCKPLSEEIKLKSRKPRICHSSKYFRHSLPSRVEKSFIPPSFTSKDHIRSSRSRYPRSFVLIDRSVSLSRVARLDSTSIPRCCPSR